MIWNRYSRGRRIFSREKILTSLLSNLIIASIVKTIFIHVFTRYTCYTYLHIRTPIEEEEEKEEETIPGNDIVENVER